MRNLLQAGRVLAMDLASTILFLVVYLTTDSLFVAVGLGMWMWLVGNIFSNVLAVLQFCAPAPVAMLQFARPSPEA